MNFFIFLTVTTLAVSLDSMLVGFAVGVKSRFSLVFSFTVSVITFVLCAAAVWIGTLLDRWLGQIVNDIGAVFLIIIGIADFLKKEGGVKGAPTAKESVTLGVAVGLDAAIANLSLCLMGYTSLLIPLFFAAAHFVMVSLGYIVANVSPLAKLGHTGKIAGLLLVAVGVLKFLQ